MWLINTQTLELKEFLEGRIPQYAILSHRWSESEVSFDEFLKGKYDLRQEGYLKIRDFCHRYAWVDSCCIDKRSSAELSESINSMFKWYRNARMCYVYLSDVDDEPDSWEYQLRRSKWFTRGWTLQELLAPREIQFFSKTWKPLGSKFELIELLSSITKIPPEYLLGYRPLGEASIAQRMSWAANRVTTREEDMAYSLLGIFDINLPLLYGEGQKAFIRLQEEIIRQSNDDSILAWGFSYSKDTLPWTPHPITGSTCGPLARHPSAFSECGSIIRCERWEGRRSCTFGRGPRVKIVTNTRPSLLPAIISYIYHYPPDTFLAL
ncbi:heterokaryon incompatibility protein-domain-containing protein [Hypoxylon sp. FL0890]|nr:heterokaryon incompatibility protein-domain-containing protein [Hypoxylon sp. FL0890]